MYGLGALYFITTLMLLFFKENKYSKIHDKVNLKSSYKLLWQIFTVPLMKKLIVVLLTFQVNLNIFLQLFLINLLLIHSG